MQLITGAQVRMARSLLKWSREELAEKASVSRGTIRTFEDDIAVRESIILDIHSVFDAHGVEFLPDGSVRPRSDGVKDFRGLGGCDCFFANIEKMLEGKNSDVICMIDNQNMLTKSTGAKGLSNFERMEKLCGIAQIKCLLLSSTIYLPAQPSFEVRVSPNVMTSSIISSQFAYGNECALAFEHDSRFNFRYPVYMVLESPHHAGKMAEVFYEYWRNAEDYATARKGQRVA